MILISVVYGMYSLLKAFALYSFWALLLIPLWIIFCGFTGIPNIINLLRLSKLFTSKEITRGLIANIITASFIFIILKLLNAEEIISNFFIGGILTSFAMPKESLISERLDQIKEQKSK